MPSHPHGQSTSPMHARSAVITLSDTRTETSDISGQRIIDLLLADGHHLAFRQIIPDDPQHLDTLLSRLESRPDIDLILATGGTGISPRDNTVPVFARHLTTILPGFGELFRMLSYQQIHSPAMLSRAIGGIANGKLLFAMPGAPDAVELAMTRLILPEIPHLLHELRK